MELFSYENYQLVINKPDVFMIKEFKDLFDTTRCKIPGDLKGLIKLRAIRELTFIYLVYDWKSPYSEFSESEKLESALADTQLTEEQLKNPVFVAACKKYQDMQDSRILKLLNSAYHQIDELRLFFDTCDLQEKDINGRPVYTAKDVIGNLANLGKLVEGINELKFQVMKERENATKLKGDVKKGMFD